MEKHNSNHSHHIQYSQCPGCYPKLLKVQETRKVRLTICKKRINNHHDQDVEINRQGLQRSHSNHNPGGKGKCSDNK